jgi:galactokinase
MRDMDQRRLTTAGMTDGAARSRATLFDRAASALGAEPTFAVWAPGRIEVLGKHVDYGGGRSIVGAVERGFCFVAHPREDDRLIVTAADLGQVIECHVATGQSADATGWANYVATVARRVARNFPGPLRGADVAFVSDLPPAAGLSSSSALVVGMFLVLDGANVLRDRPEYRQAIHRCEELGEYLGAVENGRTFGPLAGDRGVGTLGGNQDQTAILCCEAGRISRFGYLPARAEGTLAMPADLKFAIASSGVEAEKTGAAMERYNRASRLLAEALHWWNRVYGRQDDTVMRAMQSSSDAPKQLQSMTRNRAILPNEVFAVADRVRVERADRVGHFYAEAFEIVPAAWDAWAAGDWLAFGRTVDRSQLLAERLLKNQVPETIHLARHAREIGAIAASAFGAGFGGSVWALVPRNDADAFLIRWRDDYTSRFPQHAARSAFFTTAAGPAAFEFEWT